MLNNSHLNTVKNLINRDINTKDVDEVNTNVHYIVENIRGNLGVIENNFLKDINLNHHLFASERLAILMCVDDIVEKLAEKVDKAEIG